MLVLGSAARGNILVAGHFVRREPDGREDGLCGAASTRTNSTARKYILRRAQGRARALYRAGFEFPPAGIALTAVR